MKDAIVWLVSNWAAVTAAVLAVLRLAESFAIVTKTDKDNKLVATLIEFFRFG